MKPVLTVVAIITGFTIVMVCVVLVRWLNTFTALADMKDVTKNMADLAEELNERVKRGPHV